MANDNFADAVTVYITTTGDTFTSDETDLAGYGAESGEPTTGAYTHTAWWKYTPLTSGTVEIDATASPAYPAAGFSLFTGTAVGSLTILGGFSGSTSFSLTAGTVYHIQGATSGEAGHGHAFVLKVTGPATAAPPTDPENPDPEPPVDPPEPDPDDPDYSPPPWDGGGDYPDPFDPGATVPAVPPNGDGSAQSATVLDLIKQFSAAVKRPVRLTGVTSIEVCDINAPLPDGWENDDAESLYHAATRSATAGEKTLSLLAGDLSLTASAAVVADDVRPITSGWKLPDPLPVYGLRPAPVKRMSFTFSPKSFQSSVEFDFPGVPLTIRRT